MPAVIAAFQAGQAQGIAVGEILAGKTNPSGKLPVSFPYSAATLPSYYNRHPSARRDGWCDVPGSGVLWPFGHGLSYSKFTYANLKISHKDVLANGTVVVSADVTNTGPMDGQEVAQLYVRQVHTSVTTPIMALKGFDRVHLPAGATATVQFAINIAEELRVLNRRCVTCMLVHFLSFAS
jgi:beta-glucosidase